MVGTAHSSVSLSISSLLGWTSNPLSSDFSNQAGHAGDTCTHDPLQLPRQWQRTTPSSGEPLKRFSTPKALKQLVQNPVRATTHDTDTGGGCTFCFFAFVSCLLLVFPGGIVRPSEAKAEPVLLLAVCPDTQSCMIEPSMSVWGPAQMLA